MPLCKSRRRRKNKKRREKKRGKNKGTEEEKIKQNKVAIYPAKEKRKGT
jgi:hypothetical protein